MILFLLESFTVFHWNTHDYVIVWQWPYHVTSHQTLILDSRIKNKNAWTKITFILLLLIGTITYFLEDSFIVMLIFGLILFDLLIMSLISTILLENKVVDVFLIYKMSSMLIFKAWTYNFLLLIDLDKEVYIYNFLLLIILVNLLLFNLDELEEGIKVLEAIMSFMTNQAVIYLWKDLLFLSIMSLSHLDL